MKRIIYTLGVVVAFSSCSTLNNTAYVDDAYYTPGDEPETPVQTTPETKIAQNNTQKQDPDPQIANPRAEEGYKKQSNDWGVNAQDEVEYEDNQTTSGNTTVINNYYEDDYAGSYAYRFSRFGNVFYPDMYYSRGRRHYRYGFRPRLYLGWNNWSGWNAGIGFGSPWYGGYGNWGYMNNWGAFNRPFGYYNNFWPYHSHTFAFSNPYYGGWGYGNWGYNNWGYNNWGYGNGWNRYRPYRNYGYNSNRRWNNNSKNNNIRMRRGVGTTNNRPTRFTSSKYVRRPLSPQDANSGKKIDYQKYKRQRSSTGTTSTGSRGTTRTTGTSTRGTTTNRRTSAGTTSRRSTSSGTRTTTTNRRTTTTRRSTGGSTRSGTTTQRRPSTTTRRSPSTGGRSSTGATRSRGSSGGSSGSRRRR